LVAVTDSVDTGYLGVRPAVGVLSAANRNVPGGWYVLFRPQDLYPVDVHIYHIALKGPPGNFDVYIDQSFYSTAVRSDRNEYDPKQPMFVRRGQEVSFHFSSTDATATPPQVWMYARLPTGFFS
jgi:hypothetical protein